MLFFRKEKKINILGLDEMPRIDLLKICVPENELEAIGTIMSSIHEADGSLGKGLLKKNPFHLILIDDVFRNLDFMFNFPIIIFDYCIFFFHSFCSSNS